MKIRLLTLITVVLLFTGLSLRASNANANGDDKKENREVSAFSKISMSVSGNLYLTQGNEYKLVIEGDEDDLEDIETTVKGDMLRIKYDKPFGFNWNAGKVKIYVTTKEVKELTVSGSGNIMAGTPISTDDVQFSVSGSGEIEIDELEVSNIDAAISGSGDIRLGGRNSAESLDISISGSGKLHASDLKLRRSKISISGSGSCDVHVTEDLEVDVSGSGKVHYVGNPVIDADISGSGKVVKD